MGCFTLPMGVDELEMGPLLRVEERGFAFALTILGIASDFIPFVMRERMVNGFVTTHLDAGIDSFLIMFCRQKLVSDAEEKES